MKKKHIPLQHTHTLMRAESRKIYAIPILKAYLVNVSKGYMLDQKPK